MQRHGAVRSAAVSMRENLMDGVVLNAVGLMTGNAKKFTLLGLLLFASVTVHGLPPAEAIRQIPPEDREYLTSFFRGLLSQGSFAMTLFGQKAATSFDYPDQFVLNFSDPALVGRFLCESKGWRIWEKYQNLFEVSNFLFLRLNYCCKSIVFVNKRTMNSVLTSHCEFFERYFSRNPLVEKMEEFLTSAFKPNFHVKNFHIMQGLLLGYPFESCFDFQENCYIEDTLAYFPYKGDEELMGCSPAPDSLLDGYPQDLLKRRVQFKESFSMKRKWQESNPFFCTSAPGHLAFCAPCDPTVDELMQKIANLYNSSQFFDDFIAILTQ